MRLWSQAVGGEWRKCFAFIPRMTQDYHWVWLEQIEKHLFICPHPNVYPNSWIEYRRIKNHIMGLSS
jgi:hypothetical protein